MPISGQCFTFFHHWLPIISNLNDLRGERLQERGDLGLKSQSSNLILNLTRTLTFHTSQTYSSPIPIRENKAKLAQNPPWLYVIKNFSILISKISIGIRLELAEVSLELYSSEQLRIGNLNTDLGRTNFIYCQTSYQTCERDYILDQRNITKAKNKLKGEKIARAELHKNHLLFRSLQNQRKLASSNRTDIKENGYDCRITC